MLFFLFIFVVNVLSRIFLRGVEFGSFDVLRWVAKGGGFLFIVCDNIIFCFLNEIDMFRDVLFFFMFWVYVWFSY